MTGCLVSLGVMVYCFDHGATQIYMSSPRATASACISLARKYRPKTFADLVGQDLTVQALTRGLTLHRVPQCLIFSGVRGVGKTTVARLYGKALCCEKAPTAEPCGICSHCLAIDMGSHPDLCEIDAASHNGVDEIRSLQESLLYAPQKGSYRVYLLDEVHMLSLSAFNALLKTLEEPPPHVVFLFATTELDKIPETILGRCQVFHLKKISTEKILSRLDQVLKAENIACEPGSLLPLAKKGSGSLRDALTLLDQAVNLGLGTVTKEATESLCQVLSLSAVLDFLFFLLEGKTKNCLDLLASWEEEGKDLSHFVEELLRLIRGGLVAQVSQELLLDYPSDIVKRLKQLTSRKKDLHELFQRWMVCLKALDGSEQDLWVIENTALEWGFEERVYKKPEQHSHEVIQEQKAPEPEPQQLQKEPQEKTQDQEPIEPLQKTYQEALVRLIQKLKEQKPLAAKLLEDVFPIKISAQELIVSVKKDSFSSKLLEPQEQKNMEAILQSVIGYGGRFIVQAANQDYETLTDVKQKLQAEQIQLDQKTLTEKSLVRAFIEKLGAKVKKM